MTACAAVCSRGAVHLLTDGAVLDPNTGEMVATTGKVFPLVKQNAAMVVRGSPLLAALLFHHISMLGDGFDEMISSVSAAIAVLLKPHIANDRAAGTWVDFELILTGISETKGPKIFVLTSYDHPIVKEFKAWRVYDLGETVAMPGTSEILASIDVKNFDPVTDGRRLIESQRNIRDETLDGRSHFIVGAFAQLTTIGVDGIATRIIHRWATDKVGERLKPAPLA